jgi:hypothetical protein
MEIREIRSYSMTPRMNIQAMKRRGRKRTEARRRKPMASQRVEYIKPLGCNGYAQGGTGRLDMQA